LNTLYVIKKTFNGRTYYGNGLSCGKHTCSVNFFLGDFQECYTRGINAYVSGIATGARKFGGRANH